MKDTIVLKIMGRLGPDQGDEKSLRILNRVMEWGENETRHKADQRYADIILRDLGLKGNSKSVVTPGVKGKSEKGDDYDEELEGEEATLYRAAVARGIYLAQDRSDIGFAVKELNRKMAKPTRGDQATLIGEIPVESGEGHTYLFSCQGPVSRADV
jgi:hypothetical protein